MCCIVMMGGQIAKMFTTFFLWGSLFLMTYVLHITHYYFIPPIIKRWFSSHTRVLYRRLDNTQILCSHLSIIQLFEYHTAMDNNVLHTPWFVCNRLEEVTCVEHRNDSAIYMHQLLCMSMHSQKKKINVDIQCCKVACIIFYGWWIPTSKQHCLTVLSQSYIKGEEFSTI